MKLTTTPDVVQLGTEAIRTSVIDHAVQYTLNAGVPVEHARKWSAILAGPHAPALLLTPTCFIIHVTGYADSHGLMLDRVSGFVTVQPRDGRAIYRIQPDANAEQHLFLLAVERIGSLTASGSTRFWSYSLVLLETTSEVPLCLGLDLLFDGEFYRFNTSSRLYRVPRFNAATRSMEWFDRLATLSLPTNVMGVAGDAAMDDGMPILEARQNRQPRLERLSAAPLARAVSRPTLYTVPPPLVEAGTGVVGNGAGSDPYVSP
jgi:hypothetical protein